MNRIKIDYGIDLGTTNSAIARADNGNIRIIKSDRYMKDTTPSHVYWTERRVYVGDDAINKSSQALATSHRNCTYEPLDIYSEFKRAMGTDATFECRSNNQTFTPEQLSAEILKQLRSYVKDEDVRSCVITVPAKFRQNQIDATQRAAELAGFDYCELLQEPIAASIAYGIDTSLVDGHWLVFDFGGGTFDVALMKAQEGIIKVIDTEGDNRLGGKNLDMAIIDKIIMPYITDNYTIDHLLAIPGFQNTLSQRLKFFAEEIKIAFSASDRYTFVTDEPICDDDEGDEIEIDLEIAEQVFANAVHPILQRAIDITETLLHNNQIKASDLHSIVLVGGPTQLRVFRELIKNRLTEKIDVSIDPMTAISKGAAIFASTKDIPSTLRTVDNTKIQLKLRYPETTVEMEEPLGIKVIRNETASAIPAILFTEIVRSDKGWSSGRLEIQDDAEIIQLHLNQGTANTFEIRLFDQSGNVYLCEPSTITITQGLKIANATLPIGICIDVHDTLKGKQVLVSLKGLEKNVTLPARGKGTFLTAKELRPGIKEDLIRIPIYEGQVGTRAIHNEYAGQLVITGDDIPRFLPKDSEVQVTVSVDSSRRPSVKAYFPSTTG